MQFFDAFFVQWQFFLQWLEHLGFLNPINKEKSLPEPSTAAIRTESLPEAIQVESFPENIKMESMQMVIRMTDVSQQTDLSTEFQKTSAVEEQLIEQVSDLQRQSGETVDVSEEKKCKAEKLEQDLCIMAAQYNLETRRIERSRSEEMIAKEIELLQIQDECDNRILNLEISNAKLMEIIIQLETQQASLPHTDPLCKIAIHRKFDESIARIESIQEHLSSLDVATEHSKWMVSHELELIKEDISSGTSDDQQPNEDTDRLIKDSQTIKSEMETVKFALADAMKQIVALEQLESILISSESQMKAIANDKDLLLASKYAELEQLRASVEESKCKSKVSTRDVGCGTAVIELPIVQRRDIGCNTVEFPSPPSAKGKEVGCNTDALLPLPSARGKDIGCDTDDLPPLPTINRTESQRPEKRSATEIEQQLKHPALSSEKVKGKGETNAAKQLMVKPEKKIEKDKSLVEDESIMETIMESLCPSKFPPLAAAATILSPPTVEVTSPVTEIQYPSSDIRYKNKPMEGYSHMPLDGTTQVYPKPHKQASPLEPAPGFVVISKKIKQTEHQNMLTLSDIHQTLYGRVVGRGGENVKRMQTSHGVSMSMVESKTHKEFRNMIIRGGNPEKRQAAAREILESLPVTIECLTNVNLKRLGNPDFKKLINPLFVKITRPTTPNEKTTISGRINNCRKAYELLVNHNSPPTPAK